VTGVHRLQHIQGFAAAALADHDTVWAHAQRVANQITDRDCAPAICVRDLGLHAQNVLLLELQFRRVFNGNDPFLFRDKTGENVQKRGLARTCPAGNDDVQVRQNTGTDELRHLRCE
jgi:hypothetical protein